MARVTIYTRQFCGYCSAAKSLLSRRGVEFDEVDVTGAPEKRSEMIARSGRFT
ncbi:MAG TPA: glutaredoxin domain-containing protein, partial [Propylenella sp.]